MIKKVLVCNFCGKDFELATPVQVAVKGILTVSGVTGVKTTIYGDTGDDELHFHKSCFRELLDDMDDDNPAIVSEASKMNW